MTDHDRLVLALAAHDWAEEDEPDEGVTVYRRVSSHLTETLRVTWTRHKTPRFHHAELTAITNATGVYNRIVVDLIDDLIDYLTQEA